MPVGNPDSADHEGKFPRAAIVKDLLTECGAAIKASASASKIQKNKPSEADFPSFYPTTRLNHLCSSRGVWSSGVAGRVTFVILLRKMQTKAELQTSTIEFSLKAKTAPQRPLQAKVNHSFIANLCTEGNEHLNQKVKEDRRETNVKNWKAFLRSRKTAAQNREKYIFKAAEKLPI